MEQVWPAQEQKAHLVQARAWMARVPLAPGSLARALPEPGSQALRARVPPVPGSQALRARVLPVRVLPVRVRPALRVPEPRVRVRVRAPEQRVPLARVR